MKDTKSLSFTDMFKQVFDGNRECLHAPDAPVEVGEVVLGVLEDPIARSLFSFREELINSHKKFRESLSDKLPDDKKEISQLKSMVHQHLNRQQCIDMLFWEIVHTNFPKSRDASVSVGIREGWQVVVFKSGHGSSLLDILMGGGM